MLVAKRVGGAYGEAAAVRWRREVAAHAERAWSRGAGCGGGAEATSAERRLCRALAVAKSAAPLSACAPAARPPVVQARGSTLRVEKVGV